MSAGVILSDALDPEQWHLVGRNPTVETWHRYEVDNDGEVTLIVKQVLLDPEDLRDSCTEERNNLAGHRWGEGRLIGRMPDALAYTNGYMEARRAKDEPWIRRFWNDPDNAYLRIMPGRV